ncbi:MAG: HEAT repeat domain-containing protein [Fimbriimonadia bacterium]|nr:HEAT repeat domain-containing protein [Fimbriimonadia bacterium]
MNKSIQEIDKLFLTIDHDDSYAKYAALQQIRRLPLHVVEQYYSHLLRHSSALLRAEVVRILGSYDAIKYYRILCDRLENDESGHVRAICAAMMDPKQLNDCPSTVLKALHDSDWRVVYAILGGGISLISSETTRQVMKLLKHEKWEIRSAVCTLLVRSGYADERTIEVLTKLANSPEANAYNQEIKELSRNHPEMINKLFKNATLDTLISEATQLLGQKSGLTKGKQNETIPPQPKKK